MLKEKLLKQLYKSLDHTDQSLLKMFTITEQKKKVVFRMQKSFFTLDNVWDNIQREADKLKIPVSRVELYATVQELDDILQDIQWLWKGNIPYGFMFMIAGEPGIGKSLYALDLARIVTTGDKFPMSTERSKAGKVFWIDTEMKQQLLNSRSKTLGVDRSKLLIPSYEGNLLGKIDAGDENHKEHIVSVVENEKPIMLVLDSLGHSHSRGENRIEEVRPVMDFLSSLGRDYNMAVCVVHHLNKGRQDEVAEVSINRVRGSTDIVATPVVIFAIERSGEDAVKIRQIKNNIGRQQPPLKAVLDYHDADKEQVSALVYSIYQPPPPKMNKTELCAEWVKGVLNEHEEGLDFVKIVELASNEGYDRQLLYNSRRFLDGYVVFSGTGNRAHWQASTFNDRDTISEINKRSKNGKANSKRKKTAGSSGKKA